MLRRICGNTPFYFAVRLQAPMVRLSNPLSMQPGNAISNLTHLESLFHALSAGGDLSDLEADTVEWLSSGITRLARGDADTLDDALGLGTDTGISKVGNRFRRHLRDKCFLDLLQMYSKESRSGWSCAVKASEAIYSFKRDFMPMLASDSIVLSSLSDTQRVMLRLFSMDNNPTAAPSTLYRLLKETPNLLEKNEGQ